MDSHNQKLWNLTIILLYTEQLIKIGLKLKCKTPQTTNLLEENVSDKLVDISFVMIFHI